LKNNYFVSLPDEIGNLKNLQELNLENNQLKLLPPDIENLKNLKELHLENNELKLLPKFSNTAVYIKGNKLESLPDNINYNNYFGIISNYNTLNELPPFFIDWFTQNKQNLKNTAQKLVKNTIDTTKIKDESIIKLYKSIEDEIKYQNIIKLNEFENKFKTQLNLGCIGSKCLPTNVLTFFSKNGGEKTMKKKKGSNYKKKSRKNKLKITKKKKKNNRRCFDKT
jgi:Leucine-rich repeat (LRR) protein